MVYYSIKSKDWVFHQEHCPNLRNIKAENIHWFPSIYQAWNAGYRHCDCCALINKLFEQQESEIEEYCEKRDIAFSLQNGQMMVSTGYSQWKIICEEDDTGYEFVLYHKNTRNKEGDELSPIKGYHNQEKQFEALLDIIKYIVLHDSILMRRDDEIQERKEEKKKESRKKNLIYRTNIFYRAKERNRHSAGQLYSLLDNIETA